MHVYPGLENGWTGYEQLVGSRYASHGRSKQSGWSGFGLTSF